MSESFTVRIEREPRYNSSTGERRPDDTVCWIENSDRHVALVSSSAQGWEQRAALFAAAPDLLEALKATHRPADREKHADYAGSCAACAAIAKAEGRSG